MNLIRCALANSLWFLSTLPEAGRYRRALVCCEAAQHDVLQEILSKNADTEFGRRYGFAAIRSPGEYQAAVPLAEYGDFEPYISRIAAGEQGILTAETVLLLEPTSGSAAASKLIPYTKGLKRQFQRGLAPWIADLYRSFPALIIGQSYWSITPAARKPEQTSGGIPVGFEDDSDYLGGFKGWLVRSVQAVPMEVKLIGDMESFWYVTLLFLLRSRRLALGFGLEPDLPDDPLRLFAPVVAKSCRRYRRGDPDRPCIPRTVPGGTAGDEKSARCGPRRRNQVRLLQQCGFGNHPSGSLATAQTDQLLVRCRGCRAGGGTGAALSPGSDPGKGSPCHRRLCHPASHRACRVPSRAPLTFL